MLCRFRGLTQREVAAVLGVRTGVAVSCQLRRLAQLMESDRDLGEIVARIETRLGTELSKVIC